MKRRLEPPRRLCLVAAALALALTALPAATAQAPKGGSLVASGSRPDVVLMYTGDVIGYLEPCG